MENNNIPKAQENCGRKIIRKENHNYALSATYFLTINTAEKQHLFGEIVNEELQASPQGKIVEDTLRRLTDSFPKVCNLTYIIMPNHIHLLFDYINDEADIAYSESEDDTRTMREIRRTETHPDTISSLVRTIKTIITRECHRLNLPMAWHRTFYDRIVRTHQERVNIQAYILNNPKHWGLPKKTFPFSYIFYPHR